MKVRPPGHPSGPVGAVKQGKDRYSFIVWAPYCHRVSLKLVSPRPGRTIEMRKDAGGYFRADAVKVTPGTHYAYLLDGTKVRPDPASHFQPDGVHGPSAIVDHDSYRWKDGVWKGIALHDLVLYEAHIGTFTREGTFDAAIQKIPYLKKLGITCLEIMPVAQFPGSRNWGYDGVGLYAAQNSYGGPDSLKRLVDACHRSGMGVCLDVVYNHLGPEGNYLRDFGPYFTKKYHTPWGEAINYDDRGCRHVRRFVIENALFWIERYHIDALRLDAIHGIFDSSDTHILRELNARVRRKGRALGRRVLVIAESDLNDSRVIRPERQGGYALAGQWNDDFHHAAHACLTGEAGGYYRDFGRLADVEKALRDGFVYDGRYSPFRKKRHGNPVRDLAPEKLVVCVQNHDQVGNRAYGERLSQLISFDQQKAAAALLTLSPNTPLIFMGQEYGETAPFQYFIDHTDKMLVRAVREGRRREFASFGWTHTPDPKSLKTFHDSKLRWQRVNSRTGHMLWALYRDLIALRRRVVSGSRLTRVIRDKRDRWIAFEYRARDRSRYGVIISFSAAEQALTEPFRAGTFRQLCNTGWEKYGGRQRYHAPARQICLAPYAAIAGELNNTTREPSS